MEAWEAPVNRKLMRQPDVPWTGASLAGSTPAARQPTPLRENRKARKHCAKEEQLMKYIPGLEAQGPERADMGGYA
jgi:hypothetical protein